MAELDDLLKAQEFWRNDLGTAGRTALGAMLRGSEPMHFHDGTLKLISEWIELTWYLGDFPELQGIYDDIQEYLSPPPQ